MSTYKELLERLHEDIKALEHADIEFSGEHYDVDLSAPYLYACSLVEGIVQGCLDRSKVDSIEAAGNVAAGLVGLVITQGHAAMKRDNNNPGGYA